MTIRHLGLPVLAVLSTACVSTTTTSRTWDGAPGRHGQVAWVRETVQSQQGNPAGGAAVGAIVGGLFGSAITGRPAGTLLGAVGGAAVGASTSQGAAENRTYQVAVRFDDGEQQVFLFRNYCPFRVGDGVRWTRRGLVRSAVSVAATPYPGPGTHSPEPPYPPPAAIPPPPPY
jgi:outer membrane lipoprotein SlyB